MHESLCLLQEKGKYECVAGQLKTAEEMVALYVELVQSSAGVVGICNPFRPEVCQPWVCMCTRCTCSVAWVRRAVMPPLDVAGPILMA